MEVANVNQSHQAEITRLQHHVADLDMKLAKLLPDTEPAKPDQKAERAAASERAARLMRRKERFELREAALAAIDNAIDGLVQCVTNERNHRHGTMTDENGMVVDDFRDIDKETRRGLFDDHVVISAVLTRLARGGIGTRVISHEVPPVASLSSLHTRIMQQVESKDLSDLLA